MNKVILMGRLTRDPEFGNINELPLSALDLRRDHLLTELKEIEEKIQEIKRKTVEKKTVKRMP